MNQQLASPSGLAPLCGELAIAGLQRHRQICLDAAVPSCESASIDVHSWEGSQLALTVHGVPPFVTSKPTAASELVRPSPRETTGRKARVLIIDDDELTTATFAQMLRLEGHEVTTAQNAKTALTQVATLAPDAIIVDLQMPIMDGPTFVRSLRDQEHGRATPVAMVTGDYSMSQTVADALRDLGVTLCFKPLWLDDLVTLAGALLLNSSAS